MVSRRTLLGTAAAASLSAAAIAEPAKASVARPNVIVIVTDDQPKATNWATAKTRQWLATNGVNFPHAFTTTPLCAPARASVLSGRYAHNHGVRGNQHTANLDHGKTVQRLLKDNGYRTGLYGKFLNGWNINAAPPHFDEFALLQPGYQNATYNVDGTVQTINGYSTTVLKNRALGFIDRADDRPWFLYFTPYAPHGPNTPEAKYANIAVPPWSGRPSVPEANRNDKPGFIQSATGTLADGQNIRTNQLRTLLSVDDAIQALHDKLAATGQLDNTLVFFIPDNGFLWADHGWTKKSVPYTPAVELPFYVSWPAGGLSGGQTDNRLVQNIDITPTILDAAGIAIPSFVDGQSLLGTQSRTHAYSEWWKHGTAAGGPRTWATYVDHGRQYTEYYALHTDNSGTPVGTGDIIFREYYDLVNDPHQLTNLLHNATPETEAALGIAALHTSLNADRVS